MQSAGLTHETPLRLACSAPAGAGTGSTRSCLPFHDSVSTVSVPWLARVPTATQNETLVHEIERNRGATTAAGTASSLKLTPFHRSMPMLPAARHSPVVGHETAERSWPLPPVVATSRQLRPFQDSASANVPASPNDPPTAMHLMALVHEMPLKYGVPGGAAGTAGRIMRWLPAPAWAAPAWATPAWATPAPAKVTTGSSIVSPVTSSPRARDIVFTPAQAAAGACQ
jgi:hypothetical protein